MEASPIQHGHVPLVSKLESRLAIVESEHEDIERALLVTREKIEAFVNRSRKRANMNNGDEVRPHRQHVLQTVAPPRKIAIRAGEISFE